MERNTKRLLVNILAMIALAILGVYFHINNSSQWLNITILCLCFLLVSLICLSILFIKTSFRHTFSNSCVNLMWRKWTYKTIEYDSIKGITLCIAVDGKRFPIKNPNNKEKIGISLYSSRRFLYSLHPDSKCYITYQDDDLLGHWLYSENDLLQLLSKTSVDIYVTEDVYKKYKIELHSVPTIYHKRLVLCCDNKTSVLYADSPFSIVVSTKINK